MRITGLHLLLTYQCNLECDHCFAWGSPWQTGTITLEKTREILRQASELGTVEWFCFEGGEPFLFYPITGHWGQVLFFDLRRSHGSRRPLPKPGRVPSLRRRTPFVTPGLAEYQEADLDSDALSSHTGLAPWRCAVTRS